MQVKDLQALLAQCDPEAELLGFAGFEDELTEDNTFPWYFEVTRSVVCPQRGSVVLLRCEEEFEDD